MKPIAATAFWITGASGRLPSSRADPEFLLTRKRIVRRLSLEADKIELDRIEKLYRDEPDKAGKARALLVKAMGTEIANVHLGTTPLRRLLRSELKGLGDDWLAPAAEGAAERVRRDFETL